MMLGKKGEGSLLAGNRRSSVDGGRWRSREQQGGGDRMQDEQQILPRAAAQWCEEGGGHSRSLRCTRLVHPAV